MKTKKQKLDDVEGDGDATPAKRRRSDVEEVETGEKSSSLAKSKYEERLNYVTVIAKPMAPWKLARKLFKLVRKSSKIKKYLLCGLKTVQREIRRGERGIVLLAGDITPVEIMCHLPAVCEDLNIPYTYVPSKHDLGEAKGMTRPLIIVLIKEHEDYKDLFAECKTEIAKLPSPLT